jgi:hypothetical protein
MISGLMNQPFCGMLVAASAFVPVFARQNREIFSFFDFTGIHVDRHSSN